MSILSKLFGRVKSAVTNVEAKGSAFVRVVEHDTAVQVAKGKILALRAAEDAANVLLTELEAASARVHAGRDKIDARLAKLQTSL